MNSMARKINRDMVSGTRIAEIGIETLPEEVSLDHTLKFGIACYETGMIEVLRGIAEEDFEYGVGNIPITADMERFSEMANQKASDLSGKLDESTYNLFLEFDCATHDASAAEATEYYIQGFLRGYRYLKNQMEFRGGRR